jgi:glucose/arabinose dehydrogenase
MKRTLSLCALLLFAVGAQAQTYRSDEHSFTLTRVVGGLSHPWAVAFLPDGRMLITERQGRLRIAAKDGTLDPQPVSGLPQVTPHGQGGLMDVALHPGYAQNGMVYWCFAERGNDGVGSAVARGRLAGSRIESAEVIFRQTPKGTAGQHFGCRLVFDRAGLLYVTLGDRGQMDRAQKPDDHAGSVIRIHDDGQVPKDNPFAGKPGWKPEKYTLGNRNQQGAALHPATGILWTHEHGPQGGDEVNVIRPGVNYGWPVITYGVQYGIGTKIGEGTEKQGMAQPIHKWVPSIAPSGMAFYTGSRFPRWKGDLFVGSLKDQMLVRLKLDGEKVVKEERILRGVIGRIRDVRVGPEGSLYLLTDEPMGILARLDPAN